MSMQEGTGNGRGGALLVTLRRVSLAYGAGALLDAADLTLSAGERVALVGRNGAGKTTLMGLIEGSVAPDAGVVERAAGLRVARLPQAIPDYPGASVREIVAGGLGAAGGALLRHADLAARLARGEDVGAALAQAHEAVDAAGGWPLAALLDDSLARLALPAGQAFDTLSGGARRRVLLARALIAQPDLLLLDEPTNHLDIAAITALERTVAEFPGAVLFITHDRAFLRALATRIVALDRGRLTSYGGDYDAFLAARDKAEQDETRAHALFDKRLAQEEAWIRQGIKARRTRNEGRVRALEALRGERRARRAREGQVRLAAGTVQRSGRQVVVAQDLAFRWPGNAVPVVRDFSIVLPRGDKLGLVGPNGCGKTTLIRLLLGELAPEHGSVILGSNVQAAYFDQHRAALDPARSVAENVAPGSDFVEVNGTRRHVAGYLQDFLFSPQRLRSPVASLSGGERSRVALARLLAQPANLLVLDEPTNDLDVETLELLEALLVAYPGTLMVASHDREFLDNVVTSTLVFEGGGAVREYVGGYSDWLRQRPAPATEPASQAPAPARAAAPAHPPARRAKGGLTAPQRQELARLPRRIEQLEGRIAALHEAMARPGYYRAEPAALAADARALAELQAELEASYARWEALEAAAQGA